MTFGLLTWVIWIAIGSVVMLAVRRSDQCADKRCGHQSCLTSGDPGGYPVWVIALGIVGWPVIVVGVLIVAICTWAIGPLLRLIGRGLNARF